MIQFARTEDKELIKSVMCRPEIYPQMDGFDDFSLPVEQWEPTIHPHLGFVTIKEKDELLGLAICGAVSCIQLEVHNALLPHLGWKRRIKVGREFFKWLHRCGYKRAIGKVPESNRYALKYNEAIGMKQFGVNRSAIMKNGKLVDEVWFGISLPGEIN